MRRTLSIAIGAGAAAAAITMVAGVASAAPGAPHQATAPAVTATAVAKHVTKAQAVRIAEAKVPHSRAIEVQSDDLHDRAVWQVTLTTPHGRVVVDVGKRTGKAPIVRHGGSGGGHAATPCSRRASDPAPPRPARAPPRGPAVTCATGTVTEVTVTMATGTATATTATGTATATTATTAQAERGDR